MAIISVKHLFWASRLQRIIEDNQRRHFDKLLTSATTNSDNPEINCRPSSNL